jgi:hypothetical protein
MGAVSHLKGFRSISASWLFMISRTAESECGIFNVVPDNQKGTSLCRPIGDALCDNLAAPTRIKSHSQPSISR